MFNYYKAELKRSVLNRGIIVYFLLGFLFIAGLLVSLPRAAGAMDPSVEPLNLVMDIATSGLDMVFLLVLLPLLHVFFTGDYEHKTLPGVLATGTNRGTVLAGKFLSILSFLVVYLLLQIGLCSIFAIKANGANAVTFEAVGELFLYYAKAVPLLLTYLSLFLFLFAVANNTAFAAIGIFLFESLVPTILQLLIVSDFKILAPIRPLLETLMTNLPSNLLQAYAAGADYPPLLAAVAVYLILFGTLSYAVFRKKDL